MNGGDFARAAVSAEAMAHLLRGEAAFARAVLAGQGLTPPADADTPLRLARWLGVAVPGLTVDWVIECRILPLWRQGRHRDAWLLCRLCAALGGEQAVLPMAVDVALAAGRVAIAGRLAACVHSAVLRADCLANVALMGGEPAAALDHFTQAVALGGASIRMAWQFGDAALLAGRFDLAAQAAAMAPLDATLRAVRTSFIALAAGDRAQALALAEQAVRDGGTTDALAARAVASAALGRLDQAQADIDAALDQDDQSVWLLVVGAGVAALAGQPERQAACLRRARRHHRLLCRHAMRVVSALVPHPVLFAVEAP